MPFPYLYSVNEVGFFSFFFQVRKNIYSYEHNKDVIELTACPQACEE